VRELLINVVKHAETDQATISLMVDANQTLLVVVDDRGRGYDRSEVKLSNVGSNFGLASVRERMSALGGWCREESAVGLGTTITLGLPLQCDAQVGSLRAASSRPQDGVRTTPTGPIPAEELPFDSSLDK
jgi:signal transduction histidine kinase